MAAAGIIKMLKVPFMIPSGCSRKPTCKHTKKVLSNFPVDSYFVFVSKIDQSVVLRKCRHRKSAIIYESERNISHMHHHTTWCFASLKTDGGKVWCVVSLNLNYIANLALKSIWFNIKATLWVICKFNTLIFKPLIQHRKIARVHTHTRCKT